MSFQSNRQEVENVLVSLHNQVPETAKTLLSLLPALLALTTIVLTAEIQAVGSSFLQISRFRRQDSNQFILHTQKLALPAAMEAMMAELTGANQGGLGRISRPARVIFQYSMERIEAKKQKPFTSSRANTTTE